MGNLPDTYLRVNNLPRSEQFYESIGFSIKRIDDSSSTGIFTDHHSILLSTRMKPLYDQMSEYSFQPLPNQSLTYFEGNEKSVRSTLREMAIPFAVEERLWETNFVFQDPDGYRLLFRCSKNLDDELILELYRKGLTAVHLAVKGLMDEQLDTRLSETKWSIRQHVHHMIEGDLLSMLRIRMTLSEPGREIPNIMYDADVWLDQFDYASLPLQPALSLFEMTRHHVLQLLERVQNPLELGLTREGQLIKLRDLIRRLATHVLEHVEEIELIKSYIIG